MKKFFIVLICLILLTGCGKNNTISDSYNDKYLDLIDMLNSNVEFKDSSELFSITKEISQTTDGYRYFIVIDNPKIAMYNIEAVAIEKNVDYSTTMAANAGIFEGEYYSLIPNQTNVDDGYVKGVSISALTDNPTPTLYLLVQWHNKDLSITNRQFIKVDFSQTEVQEETPVEETTDAEDEGTQDE